MSLIPSQFPPIGLFDTVATAAHLSTVMELIAWTNDRLVADPIDRLPQREWVYGVPKAGIVMAAFGGMRFNVRIPMISPGCTDLISPRIPR
jgi:hypothetical protein